MSTENKTLTADEQLKFEQKQLRKEERKEDRKIRREEFCDNVKRFFSLYNINIFIEELQNIGYQAGKNILAFMIMVVGFLAFVCYLLLKIDIQYLIILGIIMVACAPYAVLMMFTSRYQAQRFTEIVGYMEQLIYAFHKTGKIRNSLIDIYEVSTGNIKRTVKQMIEVIDNDRSTSKLYEKAFGIIQSRYNCTRLKIIHEYLINVEMNGGDASASLKILIEDLRSWAERVTLYQADRRNVRIKSAISILCAMLSCGIMINLVPVEYRDQIVVENLYQIGTLIILALNVFVYLASCSALSNSYLDNEIDTKQNTKTERMHKYLANWHKKNHVKTSIIKTALALPLLGFSIYTGIMPLILVSGIIIFFLATHDFSYKQKCLKRVTKDIKKAFPIWLRSLVLHLQTDNVHVALRDSYANCPTVLKPSLETFLIDLTDDPITMRPYNNFLNVYDVPELKLTTHYLYSIATFGSEDALAQLDYLIEQNGKLEIEEERIRNEDSISMFSLIVLVPMLLAVMKLMIDLILFLNIFMGYLSVNGAI